MLYVLDKNSLNNKNQSTNQSNLRGRQHYKVYKKNFYEKDTNLRTQWIRGYRDRPFPRSFALLTFVVI